MGKAPRPYDNTPYCWSDLTWDTFERGNSFPARAIYQYQERKGIGKGLRTQWHKAFGMSRRQYVQRFLASLPPEVPRPDMWICSAGKITGEVILEWINLPRKVTLYLTTDGIEGVMSWGVNMDREMVDINPGGNPNFGFPRIESGVEMGAYYRWLIDGIPSPFLYFG